MLNKKYPCFWYIALIFATELSQIWKKILTMPRIINTALFRRPQTMSVGEELENVLNATMNNRNLNTRNDTQSASAENQNCRSKTNESYSSGDFKGNICRRTKSLNLLPIKKERCANGVWMVVKQGIIHMNTIEQELPSTTSL